MAGKIRWLEVTEEDIWKAQRLRIVAGDKFPAHHGCPVAQALKREGCHLASASLVVITTYSEKGRIKKEYITSRRASAFMRRFDRGEQVCPTRFMLREFEEYSPSTPATF